ncbi:MAG: hypothetical protein HKN76_00285 [Saprospiraceae bacterium]|nr:hypothetical protein [Saprospiraceae bacterium]
MMVLFLGSCTSTDCRETNIEGQKADLTVERKESQLFKAGSVEEVTGFLNHHPTLRDHFFYASEYPDISVLSSRIFKVIQDEYIDTLYREAIEQFDASAQSFEDRLETALGNLNSQFPQIGVPKVQTIVSGLYNDLYISDSIIVVGIDYFVGDGATFRPNDIPAYILKRYNHDYVVPSIMKFFIQDIPQYGVENTLLSEMIDFGKIYYALGVLMPCVPDHQIIGFTADEMSEVKANQEVIWASLIENEALYETSEFIKTKFLGERPNVYEIGEKCPGRIGAWVGWEIVKAYVESTGISLRELLEITNHHQLFAESGYKPQNL